MQTDGYRGRGGNIFQINSLTLLLVVIVHKKIKSWIISSFIKYTKHNTQYQVNVSKTFYISMVSLSKTFNNSFHTQGNIILNIVIVTICLISFWIRSGKYQNKTITNKKDKHAFLFFSKWRYECQGLHGNSPARSPPLPGLLFHC